MTITLFIEERRLNTTSKSEEPRVPAVEQNSPPHRPTSNDHQESVQAANNNNSDGRALHQSPRSANSSSELFCHFHIAIYLI